MFVLHTDQFVAARRASSISADETHVREILLLCDANGSRLVSERVRVRQAAWRKTGAKLSFINALEHLTEGNWRHFAMIYKNCALLVGMLAIRHFSARFDAVSFQL